MFSIQIGKWRSTLNQNHMSSTISKFFSTKKWATNIHTCTQTNTFDTFELLSQCEWWDGTDWVHFFLGICRLIKVDMNRHTMSKTSKQLGGRPRRQTLSKNKKKYPYLMAPSVRWVCNTIATRSSPNHRHTFCACVLSEWVMCVYGWMIHKHHRQ